MAENKNAQQVREITDKLEQGIKELFESVRFKEYLRTMSKFYNYSFTTRCSSRCRSQRQPMLPVIPRGSATLTVRS